MDMFVYYYNCETKPNVISDLGTTVRVEGAVLAASEEDAKCIACAQVIALFKKKRKIIDIYIQKKV